MYSSSKLSEFYPVISVNESLTGRMNKEYRFQVKIESEGEKPCVFCNQLKRNMSQTLAALQLAVAGSAVYFPRLHFFIFTI